MKLSKNIRDWIKNKLYEEKEESLENVFHRWLHKALRLEARIEALEEDRDTIAEWLSKALDKNANEQEDIALKFATFTLEKIAADPSKEGQMISAYQMLAQVTLNQIKDVLNVAES